MGYPGVFTLGILYPFESLQVAFYFSEVPLGLDILGYHIIAFEFGLQLLVIFLHFLNCKNLGFHLFFQNLYLRMENVIFADIRVQIGGISLNSVHNFLIVVDKFSYSS